MFEFNFKKKFIEMLFINKIQIIYFELNLH
jgi:hypothetical protein